MVLTIEQGELITIESSREDQKQLTIDPGVVKHTIEHKTTPNFEHINQSIEETKNIEFSVVNKDVGGFIYCVYWKMESGDIMAKIGYTTKQSLVEYLKQRYKPYTWNFILGFRTENARSAEKYLLTIVRKIYPKQQEGLEWFIIDSLQGIKNLITSTITNKTYIRHFIQSLRDKDASKPEERRTITGKYSRSSKQSLKSVMTKRYGRRR